MPGLPDDDEKTSIQIVALEPPARREHKSGFLLIVSTQSELATGRMFKISKGETVLGRGAEADFQIADEGISRRHAKIVFGEDPTHLVDLESTNGTFINGLRVQEAVLKDGESQADYVSMAPGTKVAPRLHPATPTLFVVFEGEMRWEIEKQEPFTAKRGSMVHVPSWNIF